ncbi:hypothetical protein PV318_04465 [Streptomyces sp. ME02-6991-2B]|nr:hypothetical protein [Streptomyces sp. ME02-6991-2B]
MRGPDQLLWAARVEADLDNIRAVLRRTIDAGAADDGSALALAMGWFWWLRNFRDEAREWLVRLTALAELPDDAGAPGFWPGMNLRLLHLFVVSDTMPREEMQRRETLALASRIIEVYSVPSPHSARFPGILWPFSAYIVGRHESLREHADAMVATCRAYGGTWELAAALMFRTHITIDLPGGLPRADADWPERLELSERLGDRWLCAQVFEAGVEMALAYGDYATARADLEDALRLGGELGAQDVWRRSSNAPPTRWSRSAIPFGPLVCRARPTGRGRVCRARCRKRRASARRRRPARRWGTARTSGSGPPVTASAARAPTPCSPRPPPDRAAEHLPGCGPERVLRCILENSTDGR